VRHSDGRTIYASVPLTSDRLTGAETLEKSGLTLNVSVGGSFGVAVCSIDGEGCTSPKEDCFCKSYGSPSFYWRYYTRNPDGTWRNSSLGAGNRVLRDGDVDGWSWTSGDGDLPAITLAQIMAAVQPTPAPSAATAAAPTAGAIGTTPTSIAPAAPATAESQPRVAAVAPDGSTTPLAPAEKSSGTSKGRIIGGFAAVAAVMLVLLALVPRGARRKRT
jgi:hypothetical protein